MFTVAVKFKGFTTREEWKEFAHKLYAEKKYDKYIVFESNNRCGCSDIDSFIDERAKYVKYDIFEDVIISSILSIETKSPRILSLLNEFIKENHYHYEIWHRGCKLKMTLDELLE